MDSKAVNQAIKKVIWPVLKDSGFDLHTTRTFWRHRENRIEVLNFQSFNSYLADAIGCTTFSFGVNLGIAFSCVPALQIKDRKGLPAPEEYACHFRRVIDKTLSQQKLARTDVFQIDDDGGNLDEVIKDSLTNIQTQAFPWFDKYADLEKVLNALQTSEESKTDVWGIGTFKSPRRNHMIGFVAMELGQFDLAIEAFEAVIKSKVMCDAHVLAAYAKLKNVNPTS